MSKAKSDIGHQIVSALREFRTKSYEQEMEVMDMATTAYDSALEMKDVALKKAKTAAIIMNKSAHVHPWHFIGAAAIVGLIAGLFLRR